MTKQAHFMELQEILSYLRELGDELERRGFTQPVRVVVFGGVFMLIEVQNRLSTQDVDIALLDFAEMTEANPPQETVRFQAAVHAVARKRKIKPGWCNDDGAMFLKGFTPHAQLHHWQTFNMLEILLPSREAVLVLKLMGFREKDRRDVEALCQLLQVTTRRQAQSLLNDYVAGRWQREYCVESTLDELFD
jgi:hypothetical protein